RRRRRRRGRVLARQPSVPQDPHGRRDPASLIVARTKGPALKGVFDMLRQRSLSEGVWRGHKGWMAAGAVLWGARGVRWALTREEKVLLRETLKPGETIIVREVP